jgi:DNA polymerase-1
MKRVAKNEMVFLIDGNNTCFRVGWANRHLTQAGEPTGVIFGFMKELLAIWERWRDAKIVVTWDTKSRFRMALSKQAIADGLITEKQGYYKQNRERKKKKDQEEGKVNEVAEAIEIQKETLLEVLDMTLVSQLKIEGYEADDIIGTLASIHDAKGDQVRIMSSDKDMYQLLSPNVSVWIPSGKGSMSYDQFCGEYGIEPKQWIDIGAIAGDNGDNIHGVPGIAEKTALKMLAEAEDGLGVSRGTASYKDVIGWFEMKEKKKKKEQNLIDCAKLVDIAYDLKKIDTNITSLEPAVYGKSDPRGLKKRFDDLGFQSIMNSTGLLTRRART